MEFRLKFIKGEQRKFLKEFLKINCMTITSAISYLNVGRTTFKQWLTERNTISGTKFFIICERNPELRIYKAKISEKLPQNWGQIKGGKFRVQKSKDFNKVLKKIRETKESKRLKTAQYLKKGEKLKNKILDDLIKDKTDLKFILATCLLTDGSLMIGKQGYRIAYSAKDPILKDFIKALLSKLSKFVPSEVCDKNGVYLIRINDKSLINELLKISPNYIKSPNKSQGKAKYLSGSQPSLKFLNHASLSTIKWCIRFAFTTDGCITISRNNTIELNLACYHPTLAREWLEIFGKYGIKGHLGVDRKSWCGIDGVRVYDINSIQNFAEMGGFIPGVKISAKSKRYKGLEKNMLLRRVIQKRARSFPLP